MISKTLWYPSPLKGRKSEFFSENCNFRSVRCRKLDRKFPGLGFFTSRLINEVLDDHGWWSKCGSRDPGFLFTDADADADPGDAEADIEEKKGNWSLIPMFTRGLI